jgi:hypothetical protein
MQGQRLADAIAAEHRDEFAVSRFEVQCADEPVAIDCDIEAKTR